MMSNLLIKRLREHGKLFAICSGYPVDETITIYDEAANLIELQQQQINELERKLQLEEELNHASEAGLTELSTTIEQQQLDKAVIEQELKVANRNLRLVNRKIKQQQDRIASLEAQVPKWVALTDKKPDVLEVRVKLLDGSEVNCWSQSDGDFYWKGGGCEIFIPEYNVTHWMPLPQKPKE